MPDSPVIQATRLSKTYQLGWRGSRRIEALRDVTFDVQPGEVFGLLGPNGAGKTTFIKILLGIIRTSGGQAKLLGYAAGDRRGRIKVGYLPERLQIPKHHNACTALEYYGQLSGMPLGEIAARRGPILELVGLADRAGDSVRTYSKGMAQRLGLAQALIHNPDLLMLDEPTDGLDPVGRAQVRQVLARLRDEGKTIFLNSHLLQEVELICDRVAILDQGQLKRVGPVDEMTAGESPQGPKQGVVIELEMELRGSEESVRKALGELPIKDWRTTSASHFKLTTVLENQPAVDRLIDALRSAGISILRLTPRRASLEDVFLQAIAPDKQ
jgi:ABC-2 type transport system ATP-binding protein